MCRRDSKSDWLLIEEGDTIEINIPEASIHLAVSDEELARRKAAYVQPEPNVKSGWLARYARMVASANLGAVMQLTTPYNAF